VHDDAAEYFFVVDGECLLEVGREERVARAGDLVYVPPDAPHNFHGRGDQDAWIFLLVVPNHVNNKWRISDFKPGSEDLRMEVSRPLEGDRSAARLPHPAHVVRVERGHPVSLTSENEHVYLLTSGRAHVRVGELAGNLEPRDWFHVWRGLEHELSSLSEAAELLRFDLSFKPFSGVELGGGRKLD
jgi:quercetin dioxygenase-like cupin family protein